MLCSNSLKMLFAGHARRGTKIIDSWYRCRFGKGLALSTKTRLLILAVFIGVVLFAIFYYLEGINYPYMIRYPILMATVILFIVVVATLAVVMGRRVGVPLPSSALLNYVLSVHNSIELFGFDFGIKLCPNQPFAYYETCSHGEKGAEETSKRPICLHRVSRLRLVLRMEHTRPWLDREVHA